MCSSCTHAVFQLYSELENSFFPVWKINRSGLSSQISHWETGSNSNYPQFWLGRWTLHFNMASTVARSGGKNLILQDTCNSASKINITCSAYNYKLKSNVCLWNVRLVRGPANNVYGCCHVEIQTSWLEHCFRLLFDGAHRPLPHRGEWISLCPSLIMCISPDGLLYQFVYITSIMFCVKQFVTSELIMYKVLCQIITETPWLKTHTPLSVSDCYIILIVC